MNIPIPPLEDMELTDEAQADYDEFNLYFESCTCFCGHPPCSHCTHPGNPLSLSEDRDAWKHTVKSAVRSIKQYGKLI